MMESPLDSSRPTPLLLGRQLEAWRLLTTRLDLADALHLPCKFVGTRFTCRTVHGQWMDQSHIDHFYASDKGQWIHAILCLKHVQRQSLSVHDSILLTILLALPPNTSGIHKSTYFKTNLDILKWEGIMAALQEVWNSHPSTPKNPTRSFALAWKNLRDKYKEIQEQAIEDPPQESL